MNPTIHSPPTRRALALGFVAFAWLIPSASTLGVETFLADTTAATAGEPALTYVLAQADAASVETRVSYSSQQAARGEKKYKKDCLECHGKKLKGGLNGGAPLRGVNFEKKFANGAPASAMFVYMSARMPPNSPGRYSSKTYANLMAYILKRNGFKAGAPLPSDLNVLGSIVVKK